jgi:hypothetical protein
LKRTRFQQVICEVLCYLGRSLAVVLAGHVKSIVLPLEALANSCDRALFQVQKIGDLRV